MANAGGFRARQSGAVTKGEDFYVRRAVFTGSRFPLAPPSRWAHSTGVMPSPQTSGRPHTCDENNIPLGIAGPNGAAASHEPQRRRSCVESGRRVGN